VDTRSEHRVFGGTLGYYRHRSAATACPMNFSVFVPPGTDHRPCPVLWWLSGLTCSEDNFTVKAGAYRQAAASGLIVVAPDTSPRGGAVPDADGYDIGQGAGFYVDATERPWSENFRMYSYIVDELPALVRERFPVRPGPEGIAGHSMGGHGALVIGLRNPDRYGSVSAFAPIAAPSRCPWGRKAFRTYLGTDETAWQDYDATALMARAGDRAAYPEILVDQGLADEFLDEQLRPGDFARACRESQQPLRLREHAGYDHSYFFVASFMDDHLRHHAANLGAGLQ